MFCLLRHAPYDIGTGSLTPDGIKRATTLAQTLKKSGIPWEKIHTSPNPRTMETSTILGSSLGIPVTPDGRLSMDGNYGDLLPPTEPQHLIIVSHLPILTSMLRAWSRAFHQEEPGLTEEATGYLIDPTRELIQKIPS